MKSKKGYFGDGMRMFLTIVCIIIGIFLIVFPFAYIVSIGASSGEHTGIVTAIEKNDNLVWDSNIVYFKSSDESTQEDTYCVNDLEVYNQLQEKSKTKEIITIEFSNEKWFTLKQCNGGISIINKIK